MLRRIAADHEVALGATFDAYSPASNLRRVFDTAELLVRAPQQEPDGDVSLFDEHMRNFTDEVKLDIAADVETADLSWCYLDRDPFPLWTTRHWYERIRGFGIVLEAQLTTSLPDRVFADLDGVQILLLRRHQMIYGWVGVGGFGFVDRFRLQRPLPLDPPLGNVQRFVLGCAYALSIDLRLPIPNEGRGLLKRALTASPLTFPRYEANDIYRDQVATARSVQLSIMAAHWRTTHLRLGPASEEKIMTAPPEYRHYVGNGWTWVEGSQVRGSVRETIEQLGSRTAIADAIGLAFQKPQGLS